MNLNDSYAPILDQLALGERDTDDLMRATRIPYGAILGRLMRLKDAGVIEPRGRRRKYRTWGAAYVMIWALAAPRVVEAPSESLAVAGRITIGRGSRWGAGLV